ncbi:hypothetical protein JCM1841_000325 [Sporobolomyces salmonicolor]
MADSDPKATLSALSSSLTSLEAALSPLLASPFEDLCNAQDPLASAKLEVLVSYVVHDLIWVYLKTAGVEPSTHPVMQELDRLRGYFAKLKSAEGGAAPPPTPDKPRMTLDRAAASRFISAAISSSRASVDPFYTPPSAPDSDVEAGPSGTHIRFTEEQEGEMERLLEDKEEDSEDEEGEKEADRTPGKGKEKASTGEGKRKVFDPFAGYDQPKPSAPASSGKSIPKPSSEAKRKRQDDGIGAEVPASVSSTSTTPTEELSKKQKKKLKKLGMRP